MELGFGLDRIEWNGMGLVAWGFFVFVFVFLFLLQFGLI